MMRSGKPCSMESGCAGEGDGLHDVLEARAQRGHRDGEPVLDDPAHQEMLDSRLRIFTPGVLAAADLTKGAAHPRHRLRLRRRQPRGGARGGPDRPGRRARRLAPHARARARPRSREGPPEHRARRARCDHLRGERAVRHAGLALRCHVLRGAGARLHEPPPRDEARRSYQLRVLASAREERVGIGAALRRASGVAPGRAAPPASARSVRLRRAGLPGEHPEGRGLERNRAHAGEPALRARRHAPPCRARCGS